MPHFPKPFYRKNRRRWYVEVGQKQINLGPNKDEAFQTYHDMMASPEPVPAKVDDPPPPVAMLCDRFLGWTQIHRAEPTYEGYRYRLSGSSIVTRTLASTKSSHSTCRSGPMATTSR